MRAAVFVAVVLCLGLFRGETVLEQRWDLQKMSDSVHRHGCAYSPLKKIWMSPGVFVTDATLELVGKLRVVKTESRKIPVVTKKTVACFDSVFE